MLTGQAFEATVTANGNVPVYKANGVQSLVVTVAAFFACWHFGLTTPTEVYDLFGEMLAAMVVVSFVFCLFLPVKGHVAPTDEDSGAAATSSTISGGAWSYPFLGPLNVKQFTNCRFGMMAWAVLPVIFACHQYGRRSSPTPVFVCVALMSVYNFKFFLWETALLHGHPARPRGYYICWGCLVWVPAVYASPALCIASVKPAVTLGAPVSAMFLILGLLSIWITTTATSGRPSGPPTARRSCGGRSPSSCTRSTRC